MKQRYSAFLAAVAFLLVIFFPQRANASGHTVSFTSVQNVTCNGGNNGAGTAVVTGGVGPFAYSWAPSGGTNPTISNVVAGNYVVTVTDLNDNSTATGTLTLTQPGPVVINISPSNAVICGSGTVTLTATGAATYIWNPGNMTTASPVVSPSTTTSYTVTGTTAAGCTGTRTVTVTVDPALTSTMTSTNITCNAACNGTATVTPVGGTAPYTYAWTITPQTTQSVTGLCPATYTATVTDVLGCTYSNVVSITQPTSAVSVTMSSTAAGCSLANGTATATPGGGTPPYSAHWNTTPAQNTTTATNLSPGNYSCTITDGNFCMITGTVTVGATSGPTATISNVTNVTCNASCNGSLTVTASGGTPPYTYNWSNLQATPTVNGLCAGSYTCTITDAGGCTATASATITQPVALSLSMSSVPATCGNNNGNATATVSGGNGPYAYSWNTTPVQTTATATGLAPGTYTCQVTDASGCTATNSVTIANLAGPSASIGTVTNCSCFGSCDGAVTTSLTGGTPPYTYLWNFGPMTPTVSNLCAGPYSCMISDANGCTANINTTVTQPTPVSIAVNTMIPAGCNSSDGSADVLVSGGTPGYYYSWSPPVSNMSMISNVSSGNYSLTVTDANLCTATLTLTLGDSCDYVWPGDANDDAIADNTDILDIGIANGATGTTRANASLNWIGQPSTAWGQTLLSGTDYKWVDCNGDGTIDPQDTNAVVQNFGLTHNNRLAANPPYNASVPDLSVTLNQQMVPAGSAGTLTVSLGDNTHPASNVYGIAFTLQFDGAQIDASSFRMNENGSWLGVAGNDLMGVVLRPGANSSSVQVAITRLDHMDISGSGAIANMGFVTTSNLYGSGNSQTVNFTISNVTVISSNETPQQVNAVGDSTLIMDPLIMSVPQQQNGTAMTASPNPLNESTQLTFPSTANNSTSKLVITDMQGRVVREENVTGMQTYTLQRGTLDAGVYFCTLYSNGAVTGTTKLLMK